MGRGRLAAFIVGAATIAAATFACRQLVGIGNDPPQGSPATSTDSGEEGGFTYGQGACAACVATSCGPQASACGNDPACAPFASCLAGCSGDPGCRAQCTYDNDPPLAIGETAALGACVATRCSGQCGLTCGGYAPFDTSPDAAASCQQCLCTAATACGEDVGCITEGLCEVSCQGRSDCTAACGLGGDSGTPLYESFVNAYVQSCSTSCAVGNDWACVGRVSWPDPSAAATRVNLTVVLDERATSPEGVQVKLCQQTGCKPVAGTTDANGDLAVNVQLLPYQLGPTGYFDLSPSPDAGDAGVLHSLAYWGYPLSAPSMSMTAYTTSQGGVDSLLAALHATQAAGDGYLSVSILDCLGVAAPGVRVAIDPPASQPYYFDNGSFSTTATETDAVGAVIFGNVMPGSETITATSVALGKVVGHASVSVQAQAATVVTMVPTPL
jgi:hypothetical protein